MLPFKKFGAGVKRKLRNILFKFLIENIYPLLNKLYIYIYIYINVYVYIKDYYIQDVHGQISDFLAEAGAVCDEQWRWEMRRYLSLHLSRIVVCLYAHSCIWE